MDQDPIVNRFNQLVHGFPVHLCCNLYLKTIIHVKIYNFEKNIQQRWTGKPRTSWWSPLNVDLFCRLPLPTLLYRHMFCCHCCDVSVSYVLLSKLSQICCFVVICHMSCCLTSRGTMDWLSQNDSKQSIIYLTHHPSNRDSIRLY